MAFFNRNPNKFVTVHHNAIKIWQFDQKQKKLKYFDCPLGHIKRYILNISIDSIDESAYCGTRSGDILEISLSKGIYKRSGPVDKKFGGAVNQIISEFKHLYVATQDGTIARLDKKSLLIVGQTNFVNQGLSGLAASKSKLYMISDKGQVRSVPETADLKHTSVFMNGHFDEINSL